MSGKMDLERVSELLPSMTAYAKKHRRHLEVIFHPGTALECEVNAEFCNEDANKFYLSEGRRIEFDTIMKLVRS